MESLVLFDSVVNSRWFMRTSIILFLNKVDLFRQKLGRSPLSNYFPDYSGGNDINRASKYLLWRFNQVNRAHLNLYPQWVVSVRLSRITGKLTRNTASRKLLIRQISDWCSPRWRRRFYKMHWGTRGFSELQLWYIMSDNMSILWYSLLSGAGVWWDSYRSFGAAVSRIGGNSACLISTVSGTQISHNLHFQWIGRMLSGVLLLRFTFIYISE